MLYRFLWFLSRLVCCFPHSVLLTLGKWLGILFHVVDWRHREYAVRQMMECLDLPEAEARRVERLSSINLGRNVLEILYTPALTRENFREYIEVEHLDNAEAAWNEGKGVVVYTAHIGTWEWLAATIALLGFPSTTTARTQPNDQVSLFLDAIRARNGIEVFATRSGPREMVVASRALKAGKGLGILADNDAGENGLPVTFMGRPFSAPKGHAFFAEKLGCPVLPAFILRKEDGKHKVVFGEPLHLEVGQGPGKGPVPLTVRLTEIMERTIRENPTQWIWYRRLWNTFSGERETLNEKIESKEESI